MNDLVKKENTEIAAITPMEMISHAVASGAGIEQMQSLMDLQERWEANEARKAYVSDMAEFKKTAPKLVKDKTVAFAGTSYNHITLSSAVDVLVPALAISGFSHEWITEQEDTMISVTCIITHKMGHSKSTKLSSAPDKSGKKNPIQEMMSAVTYLERYTFLAALGLAAGDQVDDDGGWATTITDVEFDEINALMDETKADKKIFCEHFKIESVSALKPADRVRAMNMLNSKKRKEK